MHANSVKKANRQATFVLQQLVLLGEKSQPWEGRKLRAPAMASGEIAAPGAGQTHRMPCRSTHGSAVALVRPDTVLPPITCASPLLRLSSTLWPFYTRIFLELRLPCFEL